MKPGNPSGLLVQIGKNQPKERAFMPHIPKIILDQSPHIEGLNLRGRGKVRDSYDLPDHPDKMLVVASNRCSIFDFVLPIFVPLKGEILTALNHFWVTGPLKGLFETDFIAAGAEIDQYLPEHLRHKPDIQKSSTVVKLLSSPDVEDIVRLILTGSGYESYVETGKVCGHRLPPDLINGSRLPFPIYTPSTKAKEGHDEHMDVNDVTDRYGAARERLALQVFLTMADFAAQKGLLMADGKMEIIRNVLIDEKGTFDACRFMDIREYEKAIAKGKLAPSLDKQYVRNKGIELGVQKDLATKRKREPTNPEDLAFVDSVVFPEEVISMTTTLCRYLFWRLTGMTIEMYQKERLGIEVEIPERKIEIFVGSESDLPQLVGGQTYLMQKAFQKRARASITVVSCHRNPVKLEEIIADKAPKTDIFIACAGQLAALAGDTKAHLCAKGYANKPVIGVGLKGETADHDLAARLSMEALPGTPVELDANGKAYFGAEGFLKACQAAVEDEFMIRTIEKKTVQINCWSTEKL